MKKIFGIIFVILFFYSYAFGTPPEVDLSSITVPGWTITAGRGIDDSGKYIVFWGNEDGGDENHSVFYDIDAEEVTKFGFSSGSTGDPLLVWGVSSNGTVACGFDKFNGNSWMWQPGIGFIDIISDVTDYDVIHASAINTAKTVVGYLECTNYYNCQGKIAFYKKNNQSIVTYQYPGGHSTELYSIPDNGEAIGSTMVNNGECIFEYNVNTDVVTDLSGTCNSFVEFRVPDIFNIETAYADYGLLESGIPQGVDHSQIHASNFSEICYSYNGRVYIWNTETNEVEEIIFPGYENDYLNIGGFSSGGTMIINVYGKKSFIAKRIKNIPFDNNWSWILYSKYYNSLGFYLNTIPFDIDVSNGSIIPIKIKIEIGGILNDGYTTNHEFNGYLEVEKNVFGTFFNIIEE